MPVAWKRLIDNRININKNHNVMIKKSLYSTPESELLVVKFEENFCTTGPTGGAGGDDNIVDDGELD